jgi:hypothetical protein
MQNYLNNIVELFVNYKMLIDKVIIMITIKYNNNYNLLILKFNNYIKKYKKKMTILEGWKNKSKVLQIFSKKIKI